MSDTLETADEIGAFIERLWRHHLRKRVSVSARMVKYAVRTRGLPAIRHGRAFVASADEVEEWWLSRRELSTLSRLSG